MEQETLNMLTQYKKEFVSKLKNFCLLNNIEANIHLTSNLLEDIIIVNENSVQDLVDKELFANGFRVDTTFTDKGKTNTIYTLKSKKIEELIRSYYLLQLI